MLQKFTSTGLLSSALPELDLPDTGAPWTVDPALSLARRVEQALATINDADEAWSRVRQ